MQRDNKAKRVRCAEVIFAVLIGVFYFFGLSSLPFVGPDEPRYAQVAREMWQRGDLVTPTLGGFTWFEKPTLYYWLEIISFNLFGVSETSARLGAALCGLLTIALVYATGKRLFISTETQSENNASFALTSALTLATSLGFIAFARSVNFDIALTFAVTLTLYAFIKTEQTYAGNQIRNEEKNLINEISTNSSASDTSAFRLSPSALLYVGLGIGLLAKGLAGVVLPGGAIFMYFLLCRRFPARAWFVSLAWGVPLMSAVAAFWYFPVIHAHGWKFINEFFVQHHFARYTSNKYSHPQSVYFYFLILPALLLPWSFFFIAGTARTIKETWRGFVENKDNDAEQSSRVFMLAWAFFPVLFFSLSGSKLPGYILPAVPGAALLAGAEIMRFIRAERKSNWLLRATATLFILSGIGALVFALATHKFSLLSAGLIAALTTAAGVFAWRASQSGEPETAQIRLRQRGIYVLALTVIFAAAIALSGDLSHLVRQDNVKSLIATADARGYGDLPLYHLHTIEYNAAFYGAGRLVYDAQGKPVKFEGGGEVAQLAQTRQRPFLLLALHEYAYQVTGRADLQSELIDSNGQVDLFVIRLR